jgi:flagellar motor switch protein FliM
LLSLAPLSGSAMLQIPLRIGYIATELMLGGVGGANQPRRSMTDLELSLMRTIVDLMLPEIRYAFEGVVNVEPTILGQESNPQFAQLAAPTDMVIVVSFDVTIENVEEEMTLCIPFAMLQPRLEELSANARNGRRSAEKQAEEQALLRQHLSEAEVEARARFRPAIATSRQIVDLEVGDVLLFNHPVGMPLTLETKGVPTYDVTIGRVNRHFAIQVAGRVPPDRHRRRSPLQILPGGDRSD